MRVMTAGSVDDGKSTLIGRLMHDLDLINDDVLADLKAASRRNGRGELDLSLYTDGLVAEREQGITIDVAYRYFKHGDRSFILCDAPGHVQYTRNMVCAASQADVALVMIDARQGATEQTHRHIRIAQLLNVSQIIIVVNKLDLVGFSQTIYDGIQLALQPILKPEQSRFVPVCALEGDNIVHRSLAGTNDTRLSWYVGPTLLDLLNETPAQSRFPVNAPLRFVVQQIMRPTGNHPRAVSHHDFRAISGRVESGVVCVGDKIVVQSAQSDYLSEATIKSIASFDGNLKQAQAGQSVYFELDHDLDVARGDIIAGKDSNVQFGRQLELVICWMHETSAKPGQRVLMAQGTRSVVAKIVAIDSVLNVVTGEYENGSQPRSLQLNDIAKVRFECAQNVILDSYHDLPRTGSVILIDPVKYDTLAAGIQDHR
jgi:sulfate adenylyltransferase subunit 1